MAGKKIMKNILITGASSYVGTNVRQYLEQYPDRYIVDSLSVRDDKWREEDLSACRDGSF